MDACTTRITPAGVLGILALFSANSLVTSVTVTTSHVNYGWHPGGVASANGSVVELENYQLPRELMNACKVTTDCRNDAYRCSEKNACECAEGYQPDSKGEVCIGAIGSKCMYDNHCIARAYCKGQTTCTCKLEYPIVSHDKWACEGSGCKPVTISLGANFYFVLLSAIWIRSYFLFI